MLSEHERQASDSSNGGIHDQDDYEIELMFEDKVDKLEYFTYFTKEKQNQLLRLQDEQKLDLFRCWKSNGQAFTRPIFEIIPRSGEQDKTVTTVPNPLNRKAA